MSSPISLAEFLEGVTELWHASSPEERLRQIFLQKAQACEADGVYPDTADHMPQIRWVLAGNDGQTQLSVGKQFRELACELINQPGWHKDTHPTTKRKVNVHQGKKYEYTALMLPRSNKTGTGFHWVEFKNNVRLPTLP